MRNNSQSHLALAILLVGLTASRRAPDRTTARSSTRSAEALPRYRYRPSPRSCPRTTTLTPLSSSQSSTASGEPTVALADINVSLTSSQENVGTIRQNVGIAAGETYAIANFTTTHTAGVDDHHGHHDRARRPPRQASRRSLPSAIRHTGDNGGAEHRSSQRGEHR